MQYVTERWNPAEGPNTLTAVALNTNGTTSTASRVITLDTMPPHVRINSPADGTVTTDASITVAGLVNDIVVGTVNNQQATVTVNGVSATVANRTFHAPNIPLSMGPNTIQATGVDRAGNGATATITVTRQPPTQPTLKIVSGNNLSNPIRTLLAAPLVVQLVNGAGQPIPNTPVVFQVTSGDGTVTTTVPPGMSSVAVNTNAQGQAQVKFILGSRAGAGNNVVQASSSGIATTPLFTESATTTPAAMIVVDSGNDQSGVVGQSLPLPFIAIVTDAGHNRLGNVPVTFTVSQGGGTINGKTGLTTASDSDGRVQAVLTLGPQDGNSNNQVQATYAGNTALPATFVASGRIPGPAQNTTISGVVLDNSNVPIPGVTMRLFQTQQGNNSNIPQQVGNPVQTNAQGYFLIQPAPVGVFKLMADGTTATNSRLFPTLEYDIVTVSGQNNTVGSPIYLPRLNPSEQLCVDPTTGGTLTLAESPGFALTIAAGSATFPGGSRTGCVSVTPVNMDKVPMVPGFGQQPRFIVTIQPVGTTFNPPAAMTIPNVDGLPARAVTEMYSYDHDLATFVAIGTGTVSTDGSVIASDPGVGVLKAGWHCGGNPNSSGSAASLAVTLTASVPVAVAGSTVNMTANGTPPLDGKYINWEVIHDPSDPNDDPTVASFVTTPSCDNQPTCVAQLQGKKIGIASVRVTFMCATTGATVTSSFVKVKFVLGLIPKEVSFTNNIAIYKDQVGSAPQIMNPVWKDTNTPDQNDAVAYVQSSTMTVTVKFAVNPIPPSPVSNVTIEGEIPGLGKFRQTGVTIPAAAEVTVAGINADTPLPNTTKFYNPMTINWRHMADGASCPNCTADGSTANKAYVTLDTPAQKVFLTTLNLAVSKDGAGDQVTAVQNTWSLIAGPANISTWDGRTLYYYRDNVGFSGCALTEESLLTAANGSGQCGSFARLLIGTLAVNNIPSDFVQIHTNDMTNFLVKNWTFAVPTYPAAPSYKWQIVFNAAAIAAGDVMVPKQPGNVYGDLTKLNTLVGQNTSPPSENVFFAHFIVKISVAGLSATYYDPSYGVTYAGADSTAAAATFEANAVEGYQDHFAGDAANVFRVRKPGGGVNINFDK